MIGGGAAGMMAAVSAAAQGASVTLLEPNERLGKNRANVVADRLVKQYKVDRSRIIVDSKGDTEQPFAENDKNRVTICIAE